ncbi:helix-turn-helix domain-containing protein [Agrobacterium rhizogenes]|uniref:helix-turn-helix domain-containing protein n=1 Tax=Rhizobium rhizogenes TaxID=359 RepID=UPI00157421EC|nr:helix-turn-helix domain-containing protein [Rhizobium rhizogenes]NTF91639.1 helix-turn-helix domain-containing protein [Rhizobium rhizogenes]
MTYYADRLGIKQDRLHDKLGTNANGVGARRLTQDARLPLERSGNSVREISDIFGFRDPAAFSYFFKRRPGVSPEQYRQIFQTGLKETELIGSTESHDWP